MEAGPRPRAGEAGGDVGDTRLTPGSDIECWLANYVPAERAKLFAEWEAAAAEWGRLQADEATRPADLWFAELVMDACREELTEFDRFAAWASGWLTRRWQGRMRQLTELW